MTAGLEREIKLEWPAAADARAAVLGVGATPLRPRRLQDDLLLDTPDRSLRARRTALRIRRDGPEGARLTFKGQPLADHMKVREELETTVGDGELLALVLSRLGFEPAFRYQKYREEFTLGAVTIALDETPVGVFVELEGTDAAAIDELAKRLGRQPVDYITASYHTLFEQRRERAGRSGPHMVFESA